MLSGTERSCILISSCLVGSAIFVATMEGALLLVLEYTIERVVSGNGEMNWGGLPGTV